MSAPVVSLRALGVDLGRTPVLRDLDLEVAPGEAVGISGANGSGKTTLLRVAATLLTPTTGTAEVLGVDVTSDARFDVRPTIGFIGHTPSLFPHLTLAENTSFAAELLGATISDVSSALAQVGLSAASSRRADHCSFGMQRRAEFATLLLAPPRLLLFDEAQAGLDSGAVELVDHLLKDVVARGGGAIVVSHQRAHGGLPLDRTLELDNGNLEVAA
ncbi:MAG: ATP-binding cassette domain-containing protein [Acidimicrobiia bacterium]